MPDWEMTRTFSPRKKRAKENGPLAVRFAFESFQSAMDR
jgi:hypothetical protein